MQFFYDSLEWNRNICQSIDYMEGGLIDRLWREITGPNSQNVN